VFVVVGNGDSFTRPGVARRLVPFFCFAKRKEPKKRRPGFVVFVAMKLRQKFPALLASEGGSGTRFLFASHCHCPCMGNGVRGLAACGSNSPLTLAETSFAHSVARRLSRGPTALELVVKVTELGSRLSMETPFGAREQGVSVSVSVLLFWFRFPP
jgi:hypothetical protein